MEPVSVFFFFFGEIGFGCTCEDDCNFRSSIFNLLLLFSGKIGFGYACEVDCNFRSVVLLLLLLFGKA